MILIAILILASTGMAPWSTSYDTHFYSRDSDKGVGTRSTSSGMGIGYIYILRNDGIVYFKDRGVNSWFPYGNGVVSSVPQTNFLDIASGTGSTSGYVYVLLKIPTHTETHSVYFTDRGVNNWLPYGQTLPPLGQDESYVALAAGSGSMAGYIFVLLDGIDYGKVYYTDRGVNGWLQYGGIIQDDVFDISVGSGSTSGYIYVLGDDSRVYYTDRGVNYYTWYGGMIPAASTYIAIASGCGPTAGYVYALLGNHYVYFTDRGVNGYQPYGINPVVPLTTPLVDITAGYGPTSGYIYALRANGEVYYAARGVGRWLQYGTTAGLQIPLGVYVGITYS
jgi:hypothetical protein